MSSTDATRDSAPATPLPKAGELWIEVVSLPVADVDRAKDFYKSLGWRLDADFDLGGGKRVVQFTPPGSSSSISFGAGLTDAEPGSVERLEVAVQDIEAAREDLIGRGVEVSEPFHLGEKGFEPGPDPERASYNTWATFSDPDGNGWLLQEITERLPGR
jgi:catechol 2,3-dioxygenase-like lactoylglutathione lyase family enzyme